MSTKTDEEIVDELFVTEWGKTATDAPRERINPYLTKSEILGIITTLRKEQEEAVAEVLKELHKEMEEDIERAMKVGFPISVAGYAKVTALLKSTQNTKTDK